MNERVKSAGSQLAYTVGSDFGCKTPNIQSTIACNTKWQKSQAIPLDFQVDVDCLGLHILLESIEAALSTNTTLLPTTPSGLREGHMRTVDGQCTDINLGGHSQSSSDV